MTAAITTEHRFLRTPDGAIWTIATCSYSFWQRYLGVFDSLRVIARVRDVPTAPVNGTRADGPGVEFHAVPQYHGPGEFTRRLPAILASLWRAVTRHDAVIMRVPSVLALLLQPMLERARHPYALEVVGDPYDAFAPGAVRHPLRPLLRTCLTRALRRQCRKAAGVAYVTTRALQCRYPCSAHMTGVSDVTLRNESFTAHYSSIAISADQILGNCRQSQSKPQARLVFVGSLEQLYKGQDILLQALADCVLAGFDLQLLVVGDGQYRGALENLAQRLQVYDRCHFLGQLPNGKAVLNVLDSADLFVLPSRTEGLPRAMIEAMARALPCIGSNVGGIPELLLEEDMVCPGDAHALARKIQEVLSDPHRLLRMSQRNRAKANDYLDNTLQKRREEFYTRLKFTMLDWTGGVQDREELVGTRQDRGLK